jgi:hypothetical protein
MRKEEAERACQGNVRNCSQSELTRRAKGNFAECLAIGCITQDDLKKESRPLAKTAFAPEDVTTSKDGRRYFDNDTISDLAKCGVINLRSRTSSLK